MSNQWNPEGFKQAIRFFYEHPRQDCGMQAGRLFQGRIEPWNNSFTTMPFHGHHMFELLLELDGLICGQDWPRAHKVLNQIRQLRSDNPEAEEDLWAGFKAAYVR
jgi:hypothetical protein